MVRTIGTCDNSCSPISIHDLSTSDLRTSPANKIAPIKIRISEWGIISRYGIFIIVKGSSHHVMSLNEKLKMPMVIVIGKRVNNPVKNKWVKYSIIFLHCLRIIVIPLKMFHLILEIKVY